MPARHELTERAMETVYRVYRLPDQFALAGQGEARESEREFAVGHYGCCDRIVAQDCQHAQDDGSRLRWQEQVARLPMTDSLLGAFKVASKQTGVPASRLLQAALSLTCKGAK